jgi:uncharacterized membrane protein YebE (DUF533 family)
MLACRRYAVEARRHQQSGTREAHAANQAIVGERSTGIKDHLCRAIGISAARADGRIDELYAKIEQLREQKKRLDAENEHLAEMVRFTPQLNAAMSAQKLDQA